MLDSAARSVVRLGDKIEEIKKTDASKLQDEYAKLVEGLQEAAEEDEDAFMSNPGMTHLASCRIIADTECLSSSRRSFERSNTRQYPKSRALCRFPEEIRGVP